MKADKAMWIASVKARVLENSDLNNDSSEFQYVECLYLATGEAEFVEEIKKAIAELRLEVVEIINCAPYHQGEWSNDDPLMAELIDEAAQKAQAEGRLTFGPFTSSNFYED